MNTVENYPDPRHRWSQGFYIDVMHALKQWHLAPSFPKFIEEVLVEANLFAILTSRGQSPDTIHRWMKQINDFTLTKEKGIGTKLYELGSFAKGLQTNEYLIY